MYGIGIVSGMLVRSMCCGGMVVSVSGQSAGRGQTRSEGGAGDKVASKVFQLASCMLEDQVGGPYAWDGRYC
jgi:hypothetical protein